MTAKNSSAATLTLPSDREILITRAFNAPRELVFDAWTRPEHMVKWYGCELLKMTTCDVDLRVGGAWRVVLEDPKSGGVHPMRGIYQEILRPEKLVFTEIYEPVPGSDHLVTLTFTGSGKTSIMSQHLEYPSLEMRNGHLNSGLEQGFQETMARLDALLAGAVSSQS